MAKPFRRKKMNFFIKKDLQGKLTWQFFLLTIGGLLVFSAIFSVLSADHLTISYENQVVQVSSTPIILMKELLTSNWIFLLTAGLIMVVIFILLTHKIAGPIYRFEVVAKNMCQRNLNQFIYLRKQDEAGDLANSLNQFNSTLSEDIRSMLGKSIQIDCALDENNLELALQENQALQQNLWVVPRPSRGVKGKLAPLIASGDP